MSFTICSQCRGSKEVSVKGTIIKKPCGRCDGTGKSPDPNAERELATFLRTKRGPLIATRTHDGSSTGAFESYK